MTRIALAAAVLLLSTVAVVSIFHDAAGRVVGKAHTDANGVTEFSDAYGRTIGRKRTDSNGVIRFYDEVGRVTGSARQR